MFHLILKNVHMVIALRLLPCHSFPVALSVMSLRDGKNHLREWLEKAKDLVLICIGKSKSLNMVGSGLKQIMLSEGLVEIQRFSRH